MNELQIYMYICVTTESEVRGHRLPPLLAAAVNPRRLLRRSLEDGSEDGDILLEDDGRHGEVALQLVCALTEILRQVGHVLPLLHLTEELDQTGGE